MRTIVKQAVTTALFLDDIEDSIEYNKYNIPHAKLQLARKVVNGLLRRMKQSGYDKMLDSWGDDTYYNRIQEHLDIPLKNHDDNTAIYLTYVQMQIHDFLRGLKFNAVGNGQYRRNTDKVSYYKKTLEMLMN